MSRPGQEQALGAGAGRREVQVPEMPAVLAGSSAALAGSSADVGRGCSAGREDSSSDSGVGSPSPSVYQPLASVAGEERYTHRDRGVERATQFCNEGAMLMSPSHLHTLHTRTHTKLPQSPLPACTQPAHARVKLGVHQ